MKVFVVDVDNGYKYSDAEHEVEAVFKTFRGATEYLLERGFIPYPVKDKEDCYTLTFENYERGKDKELEALILEFDLRD